MTSSRRAKRRRRQARTARLARTEPRWEAWQAWALAVAEACRQMAISLTPFNAALNYIARQYSGKGNMAAMSSFGSYDDRFAEKDQDTLALGSLVGIRYWSVGAGPFHDDTGRLAIQLKGARGRWLPGDNTAVCMGFDQHKQEAVPVRSCGCGFWAYWAEDWAKGTSYVTQPDVAGMVEGWGRYRAGTRGFRCSKAKLLAVCVQCESMGEAWRVACEQALAAVYQVPVYSSVATMMKAFPPSRSPAPEPRLHPGGIVHGGSAALPSWGGGGGGGGSFQFHPVTEVVACPCGIRYGLSPALGISCRCGRSWYWDGLAPPKMSDNRLSPADVAKALEQKKGAPGGLFTSSVTWTE